MITGIVTGVVLLVLLLIVGFVVIQNLSTVEESVATLITRTIINETGPLNDTPFNLSVWQQTGFANPVILKITNTTEGYDINIANATVSASGQVTNGTVDSGAWYQDVYFTYSYDSKVTSISTEGMRENFTTGIANVSNKLPTILLMVAVVMLFGILVIVWSKFKNIKDTGLGGSGGGEL